MVITTHSDMSTLMLCAIDIIYDAIEVQIPFVSFAPICYQRYFITKKVLVALPVPALNSFFSQEKMKGLEPSVSVLKPPAKQHHPFTTIFINLESSLYYFSTIFYGS